MKRLILMGAGHAHLVVLQHFLKSPLRNVELVLVTPSRWQYYSGMIPGWIAGHYTIDECRIEVEPVVRAAGGRLILDAVVAVQADQKQLRLAGGEWLSYDALSIDIGARTNLSSLNGYAGPVLSIKPLEQFYPQWQQLAESGNQAGKHLVIVGGGAAGAELAMAIAYQGQRRPDAGPRITLIAGEQGLLPDFGRRLRKLTSKALSRLDIERVNQRATGAGEALQLSCGQTLQADLIMAVTGAAPFDFLATSGLATDDKGFVLVNACHQSPSHPDVFAAGDACSRVDQSLNRSGVHAVRAGPVLAANLRAFLGGGSLSTFKPRTNTLYLIACGGKTATGSYGLLAFSGKWVWWLKDRIDRGFVAGFLRHRDNQM
ncbi:MAG TPA: FAD-dependent oxidoreductase [Marinobacter sp.]|nr:FAD-dependent oxidoreductase [Marinobacter sp.]